MQPASLPLVLRQTFAMCGGQQRLEQGMRPPTNVDLCYKER